MPAFSLSSIRPWGYILHEQYEELAKDFAVTSSLSREQRVLVLRSRKIIIILSQLIRSNELLHHSVDPSTGDNTRRIRPKG